jgi:hypothetical protein
MLQRTLRIKAEEELRDVEIIRLTRSGMFPDVSQALPSHLSGVVRKIQVIRQKKSQFFCWASESGFDGLFLQETAVLR